MNVLLNQLEVNKALFIVNDGLNYGRFFGQKTIAYQLQFTKDEILDFIEKEYCEVRDELKLDDQTHQDTSVFTKTNYCPLSQLLDHEADFEEIMKTHLDKTLFQKVFPETAKKAYVINSTDSIKIENEMILFNGRVFELPKK